MTDAGHGEKHAWRRLWRVQVEGGRLGLPADVPAWARRRHGDGPLFVWMHVLEHRQDEDPIIVLRLFRLRRRWRPGGVVGRSPRARRLTELEGVDILPAG